MPENPAHEILAAELASTRAENTRLTAGWSEAKIQIAEIRNQLATATSVLSTNQSQLSTSQSLVAGSQSQLADLQQQLARAKQPPAVVVGGGSGVVVNQAKMSQIVEWVEAGRKTQNAAPRRDAAENEIKPWVEQANKRYGGLLVILRQECTPQAVAVAQD